MKANLGILENFSFQNPFLYLKLEFSTISKNVLPTQPLHKFTVGLSTAVLLIVLLYQLKVLQKRRQSKKLTNSNTLKQLPNVQWFSVKLPILDGLISLFKMHKDGVTLLQDTVKKYGSVFKFTFGFWQVILVSDVHVVQKILESSDPEYLSKPRSVLKRAIPKEMLDGILTAKVKEWSPHRKSLASGFKYKSLANFLKHVTRATQEMVTRATDSKTSGELDNKEMKDIIFHTVVKLIVQFTMGPNFTESELLDLRKHFDTVRRILGERILNPHLMIEPIWWIHPKKREYDIAAKSINNFDLKMIAKNRLESIKSGNETDSDEGQYHCLVENMIKDGFTDDEITQEIMTFLAAGHDTIIIALDMLIFRLALHPNIQKNCQQEIDQILGGRIHSLEEPVLNFDKLFGMNELNNLKYLERCILESLRLAPITPVFPRSLKSPIKIDENRTLEACELVAISPWTIHRDPKYYPNPEVFDPDRFLPENVKKRHPYSYLPFSMGPRNCIGWKLAIMQMKVFMAGILNGFEISTGDKINDVKLYFDANLRLERPYNVTFKSRVNSNDSES